MLLRKKRCKCRKKNRTRQDFLAFFEIFIIILQEKANKQHFSLQSARKKAIFATRNTFVIDTLVIEIKFVSFQFMSQHNLLGNAGEKEAVEFLIKQGLTIRETNWRMGKMEIDIIAQEPGMVLHVVEVKTRSSDEFFDPMRSITRAKKQNMVNSANAYVRYYQLQCEIQYDVIILIGIPGSFKLEYYPDLFVPRLKTYR